MAYEKYQITSTKILMRRLMENRNIKICFKMSCLYKLQTRVAVFITRIKNRETKYKRTGGQKQGNGYNDGL